MNEETIRKYANLMKELEITELEVSENNTVIKLKKGGPSMMPPMMPPMMPAAPSAAPTDKIESNELGCDSITSPMVGVFYAAPAENADPFVKEGSHVKKGDTVCIIEAMKLMNEVTADRDGIIKKVCVNNGSAVEYGTVLFLIGD